MWWARWSVSTSVASRGNSAVNGRVWLIQAELLVKCQSALVDMEHLQGMAHQAGSPIKYGPIMPPMLAMLLIKATPVAAAAPCRKVAG